MKKSEFDKSFVTGILAGGIGIMLYDVFQLYYKFQFTDTLSFEEFNSEFSVKAFASGIVLAFALVYAIFTRKKATND